MPGVSIGTRTIDCCRCFAAIGSLTPRNRHNLHRGSMAPDVHHFLPFITTVSVPICTVLCRLVASEEATWGSVIAKHERISPFSRGPSQRCFCRSVPKRMSSSMLPVSGALQLNTSGAMIDLPVTAAMRAYSALLNFPPASLGTHRFQSPAPLALDLSSSIGIHTSQRFSDAACARKSCSSGITSLLTNISTRRSVSSASVSSSSTPSSNTASPMLANLSTRSLHS
mmetsp:Transcript_10704/g.32762  ORF Transcript_10704/g.32762 Transcript_10704/m.32762 type:complete len:226 (+) Transcript_10704:1333-2010(+)